MTVELQGHIDSAQLIELPGLRVIEPGATWRSWITNAREAINYRYLLFNLVRRDVKVRYRNSLLGVIWSLLNPLLMMLVFSLIFGKLIPREDIRQYPVFFLVGLLPWNFFTGAMLGGTVSITNNAPLIKKIYFPRDLLPTATVLSGLVNFSLAFVVLVVFLFISGLGLTVHALWLPAILITQLLFTLGLVYLLSALHVFYRDVNMVLDVTLLAWFFVTPIIYSLDWLGGVREIWGISLSPAVVMRWLNPMASIIDGYRTVLWGTTTSNGAVAMDPIYLLRTFLTAAIIFVVGYAFFCRTQYLFGEKL